MAGKNKKGFEGLEPVFGEAAAELDPGDDVTSGIELRRFLFYVYSPDVTSLRLIATDFHSLTWERSLTPSQLDDIRDDIGIGGSWSEFLDYFLDSMSSDDVKIILGSSKDDSGSVSAKLLARKSKGLPRVSFTLNQFSSSLANDALRNFSLALFRAFKNKHNDMQKEQNRSLQLEGTLKTEKEKNEYLQKQIDTLSFLSKRKVPKHKLSDKASGISDNQYNNVTESGTNTAEVIASRKDSKSTRVSHRAAPVSRRAKVRGASLKEVSDDDNE